ncbi:DUF6263 family protein [Mucilaginibacter sp. CAU 1740]|uniref:DUF6263 family protein n=1 Tax=Mucilaginibacter sp. CAU 1740 TaxID=3140365 RepID=UPI00325B46F3
MKKLNLLLLSFLSFCFFNTYAQSVSLEKGKEFEVAVHEKVNNAERNEDNQYVFAFKVTGKSDGNTILETKLVRVIINFKSPKYPLANYRFNTDSLRNLTFSNWSVTLPMVLLHQPLGITVNAKGEVLNITGIDAVLKQAEKNIGFNENANDFLKHFAEEFPKKILEQVFPVLPAQSIGYQSSWTTGKFSYKVNAINGQLLYLAINSAKEPAFIGSAVFNEVTGLAEKLQYSTAVQNSKVKAALPEYAYQQQVAYGARQYGIDTAWINMALASEGSLSNKLALNSPVDSSKVLKYFRERDGLFKNDPYYTMAKLTNYQHIDRTGSLNFYDGLLNITPNYLIKKSEIHLANKFSNGQLAPDSALQILKYLHKTKMFDEQIHLFFAQNFVELQGAEQSERRVEIRNNSMKILLLMHNEQNPLMHQKTDALYTWVNALNHKNDDAVLLAAGKRFLNMGEAEIKAGSHGERYALMVYKMLAETTHTSEANKLLDQTINTLEKLANDTLNKERLAHKNILTYAYYVKYQNALKTDSVLAFSYLARAAYNSPKQNERKVWSSFYDHFFLNSKENYRTDFIREVLKNKDNKAQASKLLAEQLTNDPTTIDEVRDIYKANYPDQNFEVFFRENVIENWLPAPDFALTDIKDNKHSLSDFKNKWLMLDFWGTWCSPCCAEMPELNRFNQELKEDKFKGVKFLSVACSDTKNKVSAYLQRNNFDITAAMANGDIEKQYGVTGYPFKVLIAPNGKMMKLKFGDDWHAIVEKLKDFYPASNN